MHAALYETTLTLLPIALLGLAAFLFVRRPDVYLRLIVEDGAVEWLQAALWFLSASAGLVAARRLRKAGLGQAALLMALFTAAAVVVGAEEISWGQRIFGWATPAPFLDANLQEETTFHNLLGGQRITAWSSIAVGLFGAAAWLFRGDARSRPGDVRRFIFPARHAALYFLPAALFFLTYNWPPVARLYVRQPAIVPSLHQEVVELLLALGVLILAVDNAVATARFAASAPTRSGPRTGTVPRSGPGA